MIKKMQEQHKLWSERNFPGEHPSWHPLLGIDEEVGELNHHYLKRVQNIRTNENHNAGIRDALGDIFIFMLDFANIEGIDLEAAIIETWDDVMKRDWQKDPVAGQVLDQLDEWKKHTAIGMRAGTVKPVVRPHDGLFSQNAMGYRAGQFIGVGQAVSLTAEEDADVERNMQELQEDYQEHPDAEGEAGPGGSRGSVDHHPVWSYLQRVYSALTNLHSE